MNNRPPQLQVNMQNNQAPYNWGMQNQNQTPNNRMGQMPGNMNQMSQNVNNWSMPNQMQTPNNRMGPIQGNMSQNNNVGSFFGNNTTQPAQSNNMGGQNQGGKTTVTNDLLDLADTSTKKDASSSIMALYSMHK